MAKWKPQHCTGPVVEPLEERQLFSADLPGAQLIATLQPVAVEQVVADQVGGDQATDALTQADDRPLELVFVDASVPDYQSLIDGLDDGQHRLQVVVIGADQDGLTVIGQTLAGQGEVAAIHILSHGASGEIQLGSETVDSQTLLNRAGVVGTWGDHLSEDADILLYGCDVAADAAGREFVDLLAQLSGADVAASDDLTGNANQGADWDLEYRSGITEAAPVLTTDNLQRWGHVLAISAEPASSAATAGASNSLTFSHTVGSGTNRLLVVEIAGGSKEPVTSVTYGGTPLTKLAEMTQGGNKARTEIWYLLSPTPGTADVIVSMGANKLFVAGATSFTGVDQTSPFGTPVSAEGTGGNPSVTLASASGESVLDVVALRDRDSGSASASQNTLWINTNGNASADAWGGSSTTPGGTSVTTNWTTAGAGGGEWAALAVAIKPAANAAPNDIDLSQTTQVAIANPGFEAQVIADSGSINSTVGVTGWTASAADTVTGVWNPPTSSYNFEAPEGQNVAFVNTSPGGHSLSQTLTETFEANRSYTLSAWVGDELPAGDSAGWEMRLYAGTQLLGKVDNTNYNPADGEFVKATLHLNADALSTYSAQYGQALKIELYNIDTGGSANAHFDDVQLEYTAIGVDQNAANGTVVADVASVTDPNAGDTFTFSLSNDAGGRFAIDANTGIVTVANGALLDYATNSSHDITIRATDQTGLSYDEVFTIQVRQPLASLPAAQPVNEDNSLVFSSANGNAITLNVAGLSGGTPQVSLSVDNGTLTLSQTTGLTFTSGDGTADAGMTFSGSVADINAALEGTSFTPSPNYNGPVSLHMTTWEDGALVGAYSFSDALNLGTDSGPGTADNGVVTGAVSASDPVHGQLAAFNAATGDRIDVSGLYGQPTNVTLAAWIDFNGVDPGDVISLGDAVVLRAGDWGAGSDALTGFFYDGSSWNETKITTTLSGAGWHHVAYVFDDVANRQALYLDGIEVASSGFGTSISFTSPAIAGGTLGNSTIGNHADPDEPKFNFDGQIDDARVYDRALSAEEIVAIKNDPPRVENDSLSITVASVNDAPSLSALSQNPTYTENGAPVGLYTFVSPNTFDSGEAQTIEEVKFTVTNVTDGADEQIVLDGSTFSLTDLASGTTATNGYGYAVSLSGTTATVTLTTTGASTADISNLLISLSYQNASEAPSTANRVFTVTSIKDSGGTANGGVDTTNPGLASTVTVNAVNDAPVIGPLGPAVSYTENDPPVILAPTATVSDIDSPNFDGGTLSVGYVGTVSMTDVTGIRNQGTGVGQISVSGTNVTYGGVVIGTFSGNAPLTVTFNANADQAAVQALARNITYANSSDYISSFSRTLRFTLTDGDGGTSASVDQSVTLTDVNDPPVNTVPGIQTVQEETQTAISGISIDDPDAFITDIATTQLTVINGVLNVTLSGSVTVSAGANDSSSVTLNGQYGDLMTVLGTVKYTGNTNVTGIAADTLTIVTSDNGNNGAGGAKTDTDTIQINITNVNDAPVLSGIEGTALAYTENDPATAVSSSIALADVDNANLASAVVQITGNYQAGEDLLAFINTASITGSWDAATGTLTLTGSDTLANYQAALRSVTYQNSSENPVTSNRTVSFTAHDGTDPSNTVTRDLAIAPVNDSPVIATNTGMTVAEGSTGTVITTAMLNEGDPDDAGAGLTFTVTTDVAHGNLRVNGAAIGVGGTFTQADIEAGLVTYDHDGSQTSSDSFAFSLADGGEDGAVAATGTFAITVTNVNDAPVNTVPGAQSLNEDTPLAIGGLSVTDADDNLSTVQLSVSNGTLNVTLAGTASVSAGANGSADLTLAGSLADINTALASLTYQGNANFNGPDTLTVLSTDSSGATDSDTVAITVNAINDAPVRVAGTLNNLTVGEDSGLTSLGLSGVTYSTGGGADESSQTLTYAVTAIPAPSAGDIFLADGSTRVTTGAYTLTDIQGMLFKPANNWNGTTAFQFNVTDSGGTANGGSDSVSQFMLITVNAVNDAPVASANSVSTSEDNSYSFSAGDFTFTDVEGDSLVSATLTNLNLAGGSLSHSGGIAVNSGDTLTAAQLNSLVYAPAANANGSPLASFDFTVNDADLGLVGAQMRIDVTPVNDSPVIAVNTGVTVAEGSTSNTITTTMLNEGDPDDAGAGLTYTVTTDVAHGTLRLSGAALAVGGTFTQADIDAGLVTYDHDGSQASSDSFAFSLADGGEDGAVVATGTFNFTVTNVNDAPVITSASTVGVAENQTGVTTVTSTDADLDTVTYSLSGGGDQGLFSIDTNTGVLTFNSAPNFEAPGDANTDGIYEVQVTANDGNGGADVQLISVTVTDVNEAPVGAVSDNDIAANTVAENSAAGTAVGITASATDPDGTDTVSYSLSNDAGGRFAIDSNTGVITVAGALDYETATSHSVTVLATSTDGSTSSRVFSIAVSNVNEAPTAANNTVTTAEDTPYTFAASDFGFGDVDGDTLAGITVTTLPAAGQLQLGGVAVSGGQAIARADIDAGLLQFVPAANANSGAYASFGFTVSDGSLDSAAHTLTIDVTPVDDPGTFGGNTSGSGAEDTVITGTLTFSDPADGATSPNFTVTGAATNGTASIDGISGAWSYTPPADFNGTDSFTVSVTDDAGNLQSQVIGITVNAVTDIAGDSDATTEDASVVTNVLANDSFEGSPLVTAVSQATNGSVSIIDAAAGTVRYTPNPNFNGSDSYTYTVTSGGINETATVTITVGQANDPGSFGGDISGSGPEDGTLSGVLTFTDAIDGASSPNFTVTAGAVNGTASIDSATGAWSYTPVANFNGNDSFTVTVTDDAGNNETQVVSLSVTPVNDAPSTSLVTLAAIAEDSGPRVITQAELLANAGDVDGDALSATGLAITAGNGTLVDNGNGTWTYTPAVNDASSVSFSYGVTDGGLITAGTATLDITPVNDTPVITSDGGGAAAALTLAENQAAVTTVTASDPDSTPTFGLVGGADQALFSIDAASGALTFNIAPDFENPADANGDNVYEVTVQASDGSLSDTQAITITVSDVNESAVGAISDSDIGANTVAENSAAGTAVGITASATDPDGTDTVSYSLSNDAGGRFAIDSNTGVISVAGALDYESAASHSVTVLATSTDGSTSSQIFSVAVSDVNEAPVGPISDNDATADTVAENSAAGTAVGITASATDPDGTDTVSYSLSSDAGGRFAIDSNTGVITVAGALDYQAASNHSITVLATSTDGSTNSQTFTITVTPVSVPLDAPSPVTPPAPNPLPPAGDLPPQSDTGSTDASAPAATGLPNADPETPAQVADRPTEILTSADTASADNTTDARSGSATLTPRYFGAVFGHIYIDLLKAAGVDLSTFDDIGDAPPLDSANQQAVFAALDRLNEELAGSGNEIQDIDNITLAAGGAAISLTTGAILWVLRTGSLAASLLSVMPLWAQIDPLPVLSAGKKLLETHFDLDDTGVPDPRNKVEDLIADGDHAEGRKT